MRWVLGWTLLFGLIISFLWQAAKLPLAPERPSAGTESQTTTSAGDENSRPPSSIEIKEAASDTLDCQSSFKECEAGERNTFLMMTMGYWHDDLAPITLEMTETGAEHPALEGLSVGRDDAMNFAARIFVNEDGVITGLKPLTPRARRVRVGITDEDGFRAVRWEFDNSCVPMAMKLVHTAPSEEALLVRDYRGELHKFVR